MDKLFPFLVGHRTQIIGIIGFFVQALGAFGVIDHETANHTSEALGPLALATFAAKVQRNATVPTPVTVVPAGTVVPPHTETITTS